MTRDDARRILENLAIISHYAAGGDVEHPLVRHDGVFVRWDACKNMNLCCLGAYRIVGPVQKAHVKLNSKQLAKETACA